VKDDADEGTGENVGESDPRDSVSRVHVEWQARPPPPVSRTEAWIGALAISGMVLARITISCGLDMLSALNMSAWVRLSAKYKRNRLCSNQRI
jgi:hypothetical protein